MRKGRVGGEGCEKGKSGRRGMCKREGWEGCEKGKGGRRGRDVRKGRVRGEGGM